MRQWLATALDSTEELDYQEALDWFGLRFRPAPEQRRAWLGLGVRTDGPRTILTEIRRGSPAANAGLDIDDELTAINNVGVAGRLSERLAALTPGNKVAFTILRRGEPLRIDVTPGTNPAEGWLLTPKPDASSDQTAHLRTWLQD